ncbi:MAG: caspase family protein [Cyanobacteriota bacterium]
MARNWAIVVGINQYSTFLSPLKYAKQDAELIRDLFKELEFDEICLFTEDSPPQQVRHRRLPTYPSYGNLHGFLWEGFQEPFLSTGDNLWFFFAGHGMQYANRDYLMLVDTHPNNIAATGISVDYIQERLVRSGADNVILLLDACRNRGYRGVNQISREARQGIVTIFSCSPQEVSWEVDELQHGVFTYCLDEALNPKKGNLENLKCATVEGLNNHLRRRVPFVCEWYKKFPVQTPFTKIAPLEKAHLILFPKYAQPEDVDKLHKDAQEAFLKYNLNLAEQLCIRANEAAQGQNKNVLSLLVQIKKND